MCRSHMLFLRKKMRKRDQDPGYDDRSDFPRHDDMHPRTQSVFEAPSRVLLLWNMRYPTDLEAERLLREHILAPYASTIVQIRAQQTGRRAAVEFRSDEDAWRACRLVSEKFNEFRFHREVNSPDLPQFFPQTREQRSWKRMKTDNPDAAANARRRIDEKEGALLVAMRTGADPSSVIGPTRADDEAPPGPPPPRASPLPQLPNIVLSLPVPPQHPEISPFMHPSQPQKPRVRAPDLENEDDDDDVPT